MNRLQMMGLALCGALLYSATGFAMDVDNFHVQDLQGRTLEVSIRLGDTAQSVMNGLINSGYATRGQRLYLSNGILPDNFVFDNAILRKMRMREGLLRILNAIPVYTIGGEATLENIRNAARDRNREFKAGDMVVVKVKGKYVVGKVISPSPELPGYYLILTDKERDHDPDEIIGKL